MGITSIGAIAEFINGYAFKPSDWHNTGTKIIRIQNLTDSSKPYNTTKLEIPRKYIVTKGDILVSWSATLDVFEWNNEDAYLNQHIFKVEPDNKIVDKIYLKYALKYVIDSMRKLTHGSTMKHIVKDDFNNTLIPLPNLAKQKSIGLLLDKASSIIEQRKFSIKLSEELLRSTFLEMFGDPFLNDYGWPTEKIKDLAADIPNSIKAGPFGSTLKKDCYVQDGYKVYGQEQVIRDDFEYGDYFINEDKYKELENYKIKSGDILISLVGTYGEISIVPHSFKPGIINPRLMKISLDESKMLPCFFKHLLISNGMRTKIKSFSHGGTMDIVNVGIIKNLKIPSPPIMLQNKFELILSKVKKIQFKYLLSLKEIENEYNSLMQKIFRIIEN